MRALKLLLPHQWSKLLQYSHLSLQYRPLQYSQQGTGQRRNWTR